MRALRWAFVGSFVGLVAAGCTDSHRTGKHRGGAGAAVTSADASVDPLAVRGTAAFEDTLVDPETGQVTERRPVPVVGAVVLLVDRERTVVGLGATREDGSFAVSIQRPGVTEVVAVVEARSAIVARVGVFAAPGLGRPHLLASEPVAAGGAVQLLARGEAAVPFDLLATVQRGALFARALEPERGLPDLRVEWAPDTNGTYFDPADDGHVLHVDAEDGVDDAIVLHEVGHWVQEAHVGDPSPGGVHLLCPARVPQVLDRRLAFSEAFASVYSAIVRDDPRLFEVGAGVVQDLERPCLQARGPGAENAVAALLWDLYDGGAAAPASADAEQAAVPLRALWAALRRLADVPHFDVAAFADALLAGGEVSRATWDAVASPLGLALPLPALAQALKLGKQASGAIDASVGQDSRLAASGYHLVEVPAAGTLKVTASAGAPATLLVFAPRPHGAFVEVEIGSKAATLEAPALVPGKYLVQVRAKGDGKGRANTCYSVKATFTPGEVTP